MPTMLKKRVSKKNRLGDKQMFNQGSRSTGSKKGEDCVEPKPHKVQVRPDYDGRYCR